MLFTNSIFAISSSLKSLSVSESAELLQPMVKTEIKAANDKEFVFIIIGRLESWHGLFEERSEDVVAVGIDEEQE